MCGEGAAVGSLGKAEQSDVGWLQDAAAAAAAAQPAHFSRAQCTACPTGPGKEGKRGNQRPCLRGEMKH